MHNVLRSADASWSKEQLEASNAVSHSSEFFACLTASVGRHKPGRTQAVWLLQATLQEEYTVVLIASTNNTDVGCILAWSAYSALMSTSALALQNAANTSLLPCRLIGEELQILDIAVRPEHRRQGHGQHLLMALLQTAKQRGCSIAMLEVSINNIAAIQLYERVGFRSVHERKAYYSDGSDALLLNLAICG